MTDPLLLVPGLTPLEQLELEETLKQDVDFRPDELSPDQHGEFLTATAVVAVSTLAIKALAAWLAKSHGRDNTLEEQIEIELPDGTKISHKFAVKSRSASELPAETASALSELLQSRGGMSLAN